MRLDISGELSLESVKDLSLGLFAYISSLKGRGFPNDGVHLGLDQNGDAPSVED